MWRRVLVLTFGLGVPLGPHGASAKHSAASQHVIPPDHRDIVSVVCQICIFQWNSMKIIENSMKINDLVGSEPIYNGLLK